MNQDLKNELLAAMSAMLDRRLAGVVAPPAQPPTLQPPQHSQPPRQPPRQPPQLPLSQPPQLPLSQPPQAQEEEQALLCDESQQPDGYDTPEFRFRRSHSNASLSRSYSNASSSLSRSSLSRSSSSLSRSSSRSRGSLRMSRKRRFDLSFESSDEEGLLSSPPKNKRRRKRKPTDPQLVADTKVVTGPMLEALDVKYLAPLNSLLFRRMFKRTKNINGTRELKKNPDIDLKLFKRLARPILRTILGNAVMVDRDLLSRYYRAALRVVKKRRANHVQTWRLKARHKPLIYDGRNLFGESLAIRARNEDGGDLGSTAVCSDTTLDYDAGAYDDDDAGAGSDTAFDIYSPPPSDVGAGSDDDAAGDDNAGDDAAGDDNAGDDNAGDDAGAGSDGSTAVGSDDDTAVGSDDDDVGDDNAGGAHPTAPRPPCNITPVSTICSDCGAAVECNSYRAKPSPIRCLPCLDKHVKGKYVSMVHEGRPSGKKARADVSAERDEGGKKKRMRRTTCKWCGSTTHVTKSSRQCPYNKKNQAAAVAANTAVGDNAVATAAAAAATAAAAAATAGLLVCYRDSSHSTPTTPDDLSRGQRFDIGDCCGIGGVFHPPPSPDNAEPSSTTPDAPPSRDNADPSSTTPDADIVPVTPPEPVRQRFQVGDNVIAKWKTRQHYLAHVTGYEDGKYTVYFLDHHDKKGLKDKDLREYDGTYLTRSCMIGKVFEEEGDHELAAGTFRVRNIAENEYICIRVAGTEKGQLVNYKIGHVIKTYEEAKQKARQEGVGEVLSSKRRRRAW